MALQNLVPISVNLRDNHLLVNTFIKKSPATNAKLNVDVHVDMVNQYQKTINITLKDKLITGNKQYCFDIIFNDIMFDHNADEQAKDGVMLFVESLFRQVVMSCKRVYKIVSGRNYIKVYYSNKLVQEVEIILLNDYANN